MTSLRILTVCTHNRTRSVLMGALLHHHLLPHGAEFGIATGGFRDEGQPATEPAVRLLRERGIDVSRHLSRRVDGRLVAEADVIVTAERDHVVWIAGTHPGSFVRTFTLPELVRRAEQHGARDGDEVRAWLARVNQGRPIAADYLDAPVGEIVDPTGQAPQVWERVLDELDRLTARLAALLV
jgi:protein-tyrosine phosphatase